MTFSLNRKVVCSFAQQSNDSTDMDCDGGDYIFEIDQSVDHTTFAVTMSDNSILVYDANTLTLQHKIQAHQDTINSIEFSKVTPSLLFSASSDKHVCLWDVRTTSSSPCIKLKLANEVTGMSVSMNDSLLSAGVESAILFYDIRLGNFVQNKKHTHLAEYADLHSDMITQLKFNPTSPNLLTSASEDGLICILNTATAEEEDAVVSILNTECPIRKFGFFGVNDECIYALSTVETASFWHYPTAQRLASFPNIRESLQVDYLVDCIYEPLSDKLCILAGSYNGNGYLAEMEPDSCKVVNTFNDGHAATIRCCTALRNSVGGVHNIVTGGEDSRLCSWQTIENSSSSHNQQLDVAVNGNVTTTHHISNATSSLKKKKSKHRESNDMHHRPY